MPEFGHFVPDVLIHFVPFSLPRTQSRDFRFTTNAKPAPMRLDDRRRLRGGGKETSVKGERKKYDMENIEKYDVEVKRKNERDIGAILGLGRVKIWSVSVPKSLCNYCISATAISLFGRVVF